MSTSNQKPLEQDWKAQLKNHNFFRASVQPNGRTLKAEGHPAKLQPPPPGGGSGADAVRTAMLSGALRRGNTAHCSQQQFSSKEKRRTTKEVPGGRRAGHRWDIYHRRNNVLEYKRDFLLNRYPIYCYTPNRQARDGIQPEGLQGRAQTNYKTAQAPAITPISCQKELAKLAKPEPTQESKSKRTCRDAPSFS